MAIPTQEELDITRDTLEWLVANTRALEPHAQHTINIWEESAQSLSGADELEDHEDGKR